METLLFEQKGPVAWVWLNRPNRLNVINETMLAELRQTFERLDGDKETRAVVVAAHGPVFSAGFDITWMAGRDAEAVSRGLASAESVYDAVEACSRPVIVAVQGPAMGGGLLLALVADYCLAADTATFGTPEVKIGIFPNLRLIPRLERLVGLRAAKQLVLGGEPAGAAEALSWGLVNRVLPSDRLHAEAQALAEQLAALPTAALQTGKAAFAASRGPDYAAWERAQFADCWARPEREAAMRAFLQRR
jgi:enoyl-CoA hydratase/carnithine racemase